MTCKGERDGKRQPRFWGLTSLPPIGCEGRKTFVETGHMTWSIFHMGSCFQKMLPPPVEWEDEVL